TSRQLRLRSRQQSSARRRQRFPRTVRSRFQIPRKLESELRRFLHSMKTKRRGGTCAKPSFTTFREQVTEVDSRRSALGHSPFERLPCALRRVSGGKFL